MTNIYAGFSFFLEKQLSNPTNLNPTNPKNRRILQETFTHPTFCFAAFVIVYFLYKMQKK